MTISSELILFYSACSGVGSLQPITNEVLHHKAANMVIDRRYYINCDVYLSTHGKHSTSPATAAQYLLRKRDNNSANHDSQDCYRPTTAVISKCTISRPILRHTKKKQNRIALTIFVYELLLNKLNTGISISYTYSTSLLFFYFVSYVIRCLPKHYCVCSINEYTCTALREDKSQRIPSVITLSTGVNRW